MINPTIDPEVFHSEKPSHTINMGDMDAESIAFMLSQSRDGFYSNKELAPIREYSTNAFDAHIEAGIPTTPIEITLPTSMEPELKIRDFGNGLSESQLEQVYFKYWKSTKRNSKEQNGFLGIGAKSAMAYSDIYTIISICNGRKMVYTAHRNGVAQRIYDGENIGNEKSGIEVIIPVQQKDIQKFITEALNFFQYCDIKPIFKNIEEETVKAAFSTMNTTPFLFERGWSVRPSGYGSGKTVAVMANVAYAIDWSQVKNSLAPGLYQKINGIFEFLQENLTTLNFDNGSLSFTPNRESLQYNDLTIAELSKKLTAIYDCLLNLISSKISDAPNIWEAKIRYNQIFRKELDGFDRSMVFGGNLSTVENLLRNRIQWNGITIENGCFELKTFSPILTTYVKKGDGVGVSKLNISRRYSYQIGNNSKMICSPKSIVIIQDTDKTLLTKGFARWIFYKSGLDTSQVYVLDFTDSKVKEDFYKTYNFETVPVKVISENEMLIKTYLKSVRAPRSTNGAPRESRPLNCPYVTIENRRSSTYVSNPYWSREDVNARGLSDGVERYYVVYTKSNFSFGNRTISHDDANQFWQSIYQLALMSGVDLPKVYGIYPKTAESAWFKEEIEEGNWIELSEFIEENSDVLPKDILKKISAYTDVDGRLGILLAKEMLPLLTNENGVAVKYFTEISEFTKHWDNRCMPTWLGIEGCHHADIDKQYFKDINAQMKKKYPLLFKTNAWNNLANCDARNVGYKLDFPFVRELSEYVNLIDLHTQS